MIRFEQKGNFNKLYHFLNSASLDISLAYLNAYGEKGVEALRDATPKLTGATANAWRYEIVREQSGAVKIEWHNDQIENGVNVAILLQYGHASKNGYWVSGVDYINPALKPVFEEMAQNAWKEGLLK